MEEHFPLRVKEASPLIDGSFHDRIVIMREWQIRSTGLHEVLIDMEARAERLQRSFQTLDSINLLPLIETLVVDPFHRKYHPQIARLSEKDTLIPEAVEVDMVVECRSTLPWLD